MDIEVGSAVDFERLICTIWLSDAYGLIISEETPGDYKVTVGSLLPDQQKIFSYAKNDPRAQVPVWALADALNRGIAALKALDRPRPSD